MAWIDRVLVFVVLVAILLLLAFGWFINYEPDRNSIRPVGSQGYQVTGPLPKVSP